MKRNLNLTFANIGVKNHLPTIHGDRGLNLHQLTYLSTSLIPPLEAGGRKHIRSILKKSQDRNKTQRVTGALTYNEFHFAQVLEGDRIDVERIFSDIKADSRHTNVLMIEEKRIARRDFPEWFMGYVGDFGGSDALSSKMFPYGVGNKANENAVALIEMMKFFLRSSEPED